MNFIKVEADKGSGLRADYVNLDQVVYVELNGGRPKLFLYDGGYVCVSERSAGSVLRALMVSSGAERS